MNETKIMLPAAGSLTDFFTAISTLANEYQAAGNAVLIGIALLILGSKFLIGDDETKARGRKHAMRRAEKACRSHFHLRRSRQSIKVPLTRAISRNFPYIQKSPGQSRGTKA